MAPVISRSLASASVASLPYPVSSFSVNKSGIRRVGLLGSAFLPRNGFRNGFLKSGLKWELDGRENRIIVKCEGGGGASAVAEKEAPEASGETHEYQAEVGFLYREFIMVFIVLNFFLHSFRRGENMLEDSNI